MPVFANPQLSELASAAPTFEESVRLKLRSHAKPKLCQSHTDAEDAISYNAVLSSCEARAGLLVGVLGFGLSSDVVCAPKNGLKG